MREKQIEGMIEAIKKCSCVYTDCEQECSQCSNEELYDDTINHIARTIYNAGYRKQSEGEWIEKYKGQFANPIYVCSICGKGTLLKPHINELGNMEMVQALSPFCPNCGARMKGENK